MIIERNRRSNIFFCDNNSRTTTAEEPPPYEVAIRMPKPNPIEPPPFSTHSDSYSSPISILTPTILTTLNYPPPILAENLDGGEAQTRRSASPPPNIFETKEIRAL